MTQQQQQQRPYNSLSSLPASPSLAPAWPGSSVNSVHSGNSEALSHLTGEKTEASQTEGLLGFLKCQPQDLVILWGLTNVTPELPTSCIVL